MNLKEAVAKSIEVFRENKNDDDDAIIRKLIELGIVEPLASYGPFVMNTQTEIMEAIRDYQSGKMGMLTY